MNTSPPRALEMLAHYTMCNMIFSGYKIGIFNNFISDPEDGIFDLNSILSEDNIDKRFTEGIVQYLLSRKILLKTNEPNIFKLGKLGIHLIKENWISYILYFVGGYGNIVSNAEELATNKIKYGQDIIRNIDWVAKGTEMMSLTEHHKSYSAVLEASKKKASKNVLDIGCGTGNFLIKLANSSNSRLAIGIDISSKACKIARDNVRNRKKEIEIVEGDFISKTNFLTEKYGNFDVVTALMILHEYLYSGEEKIISVLKSISKLLSHGGSFILLDKIVDNLELSPFYLTEFKLVHDLTLQNLCTRKKWHELIGKSGMKIIKEVVLPVHTGSILIECVKK